MTPLRPLLPSATRPRNEPLPPVKRERVASACDQCRAKKIKCTGDRPVCLECARRSTTCEYDTRSTETQGQALKRKLVALQRESATYVELYNLIRTRPEKEALEIVRRIKTSPDVEDVLRRIKEADSLIQLNTRPEIRKEYSLSYINTALSQSSDSCDPVPASSSLSKPTSDPYSVSSLDGPADAAPRSPSSTSQPSYEASRVHGRHT
jgi:hypothetical protein